MTFSPLGFGNWIPVIIAGQRPKSGQDVLSFKIDGYKPNHPSPKPISCMKKLVDRLSKPNDTILDCFLGSGTTAVACKELNRNCIGIEISPEYYKIAEQRIKNTQELLI
jgi:DNA modification methylase